MLLGKEMLIAIKKSDYIGLMIEATGRHGQTADYILTAPGDLCRIVATEEATEVIEQAVNEWGMDEVFTPVMQSQLYHAVLLEIEAILFAEAVGGEFTLDEIPFT